MKTPDEIKKGLECCIPRDYESTCRKCPYSRDDSSAECIADLEKDALDYIQQLESRLAQVERERDAAVSDLKYVVTLNEICTLCAHDVGLDTNCEESNFDCAKCKTPCVCKNCTSSCSWQYGGICEENTHDQP